MNIKLVNYKDCWQEIKDAALFTIHKHKGTYPDKEWKLKMLRCEHSPIRSGKITFELYDVPSFVIGHLVRHNVGITPFVSTLRNDRVDYKEGEIPNRETLNDVRFDANFQAMINISRKRLCNCASPETRQAWQLVKDEVAKVEPELAHCMVRECIYRNGYCPEMFSCGYNKTDAFKKELEEYRSDEL